MSPLRTRLSAAHRSAFLLLGEKSIATPILRSAMAGSPGRPLDFSFCFRFGYLQGRFGLDPSRDKACRVRAAPSAALHLRETTTGAPPCAGCLSRLTRSARVDAYVACLGEKRGPRWVRLVWAWPNHDPTLIRART